jgi:cytoskeletal protein CcmA (bactofilin family)
MAMNPDRTSTSCISRITRISGELELRGLVEIEGEAEGEIIGDDIEIAPSAVVTARITANRLKVGGQVNGEIGVTKGKVRPGAIEFPLLDLDLALSC